MDDDQNYWALSDLTPELIQAVIESLMSLDYLYKNEGKFPLLWITETGRIAIVRDFLLKNDNEELQTYLKIRLWTKSLYKKESNIKEKKDKVDTYEETLKLLKSWKNLEEISKIRDLKPITIESHIVSLYSDSKLWLSDIMKFTIFSKLKSIKDIIIWDLNWVIWELKVIKEKVEVLWYNDISYFDIKIAIAMIEKKDL